MEAPGPGGRRRLPQRLGAEDEALNQIAREAEAQLAAKRAARAEAREIRMKELERQQKEIYQVQKKYYGLDTKWGDIEQWMEDSERYSHRSRRNASVSDEDERMSVGSRGSLRGNYNSDLGLPPCGTNSKAPPAAQNGSRPSEYSCYLGSGSRASSRTSSARASPVVEERPDKDFNDKGARTASSLSAATLASLGGTSSRRGSGDTSISVDTEASIREIKDSLAEVEEKYKKAMVSNAQLDNEKTNFMYQVDTLKDVLLELEEQLAETHRQYEEKSKEFEREKHGHRILQVQYNELKESLQQRDELLTRHGIVLCSDLSPNGGILDGPLHEALLESSTKVMDNAAPKTGDGPLGSASEVKLKSETAVEGQSVLSSKTTEDAGVQTEETSLLSERQEEAECSGGSSAELPCTSADGHIESFITAGEQVAKKTDLHNVDSIPSCGIGLDASIVTNPAVNSSSEASERHVKETNTLQTQRDVETKSRIENQLGDVEFERAKCSEKESLRDDFQDAVDFSNEPTISSEKELHNHDKRIVATNEEPKERPVLESPKAGFNIKGILQNFGRRLDKVFDKVDGPVDSASDSSKESSPPNIHLELEVSGVSAQALEGDKDSFVPSVGTVGCSKEAAGAKDGEDIASIEPLENSVVTTEVISSCGDGSFVVDGTIQGQADRGIPFGGKGIEPDIALSGVCVALENHEVKGHVKEVDIEGKAHSDEGEFYECSSEGSSPTGAVLEPKLEEPLNDTQHQEASNTGFSVSSPQTLEEMDTNTKEQVTETFRDDPSQLRHMHNPDIKLCNAKVEDEKNIEEQGLEGGGTVTSQGHDTQEAGINKITSQHDLGQNGDTREDGDSFQFDEDGENVDPSPTVAQEFAKGNAEEEHINGSTPTSVTEIPVQALPKLQNKSVLTEANNDAHQEGLSPEATEKETEVSSLPPSQETSNIEIKHDLEQSTPSQGMENTFVDPSEPLGLSDSPGYSKEDTLDRNIKRGKSKNKEDCLLS